MKFIRHMSRGRQRMLDGVVPYRRGRWAIAGIFTAVVLYRILVYDFLAILFFWGLYVLYLLVQFFTPSGLPDPDEDFF
jgi:hypothetical protein